MSRSRPQVLIWRRRDSERWFKQHANRVLRRRVREAIIHEREVMPLLREVSDVWMKSDDYRRPHWTCHYPQYYTHPAWECYCVESFIEVRTK